MLNLNGLSNIEQIILLACALLVAYVVFKTLAGLLRIVLVVAVLAWLWIFVFKPTTLKNEIDTQVAKLSPQATYAVAELNRCLKETLAGAGSPESERKRQVLGVLQREAAMWPRLRAKSRLSFKKFIKKP